MAIITVDFESFYSSEYSLSKMSEESYILDERFETIMAAVKVDDQPSEIHVGHRAVAARLARIDWQNSAFLAHNARFDGSILAWRFGIRPALYLDTLSMARATTHWKTGSSSLKMVARHLGLPPKGTEVYRMIGKRLEDFTHQELDAYAEYCALDNDLCKSIFDILRPQIPNSEIRLIDLFLRMFVEPQIQLDANVLAKYLHQVRNERALALDRVAGLPQVASMAADCRTKRITDPQTLLKMVFSSNQKFAKLLEHYAVDVPMKNSPTTGEAIPALSKNDRGFKELCQDLSQPAEVQAILAARLGAKSSLEEARTEKLLEMSRRNWADGVGGAVWGRRGMGYAPVPLRFYGARTGRPSGDSGLNWLNFKRGALVRDAIVAPPGYRIVHRDASQIEARMVAWLAGCTDLVTAFAEGRDVYCEFAEKVYKRPVTKNDKLERFIGKTCLAAGTRVITNRGPVPIEQVRATDQLWDGVEWVRHDGLVMQGIKETLTLSGVCLTPDHHVLCGTEMKPIGSVVAPGSIRFPRSVLEVANLPSLDTYSAFGVYKPLSFSVIAEYLNTLSIGVTLKPLKARVVMNALRKLLRRNGTGSTLMRCRTMGIGPAFSTASRRRLRDATAQVHVFINIMGCVVSQFMMSGGATALRSFDTHSPCRVGTTQNLRWIVSTSTEDIPQETLGLYLGPLTCLTSAKSLTSKNAFETLRQSYEDWKPVYDLVNAGPRHRFTILSDDGPVCVSNCILGLGYGCGWNKFRHMLFIGSGGVSHNATEEEALGIVDTYRRTYSEIPALWKACDKMLRTLGEPDQFTPAQLDGLVTPQEWPRGLVLPNQMLIAYPGLKLRRDPATQETGMVYDSPYKDEVKIYGAKCVENITQGLARIVVTDVALRVWDKLKLHPFLTTYDSLDFVIHEDRVEELDALLEKEFAVRPSWAPELPLASEGGFGQSLLAAERGDNV